MILSGTVALDPAWRETVMMLLCVSAGDTVGDHGVRPGVEGDNDDVIVCVSAGDTVGNHGVRPGVEGDNDDVIVCVSR